MDNIEALIVEDDAMSLKILKSQLRKHLNNVHIGGACSTVKEGIHLSKKLKPHILYLDINLGNEESFTIIEDLSNEEFMPQVIFITSHEEFAVKAIKYDPIDFILKPIAKNALIKATNKAISKIENNEKLELIKQHEAIQEYKDFIAIPSIDIIEIIKTENIIFCEAEGRYTKFHLINGDTKLASRNLGIYEKILDPKIFFRVHHSYLINVYMIHHINKTDGYYCHLLNHKSLPIARRKQESLNRFLNLK